MSTSPSTLQIAYAMRPGLWWCMGPIFFDCFRFTFTDFPLLTKLGIDGQVGVKAELLSKH